MPGGESYVRVAERAKQWLAKKRHAPITIAVTHAIISRTIQGAYGGFTPSQTVARSHPQDRIYRLHAGRVEEISCWYQRSDYSIFRFRISVSAPPELIMLCSGPFLAARISLDFSTT